MVTWKHILIIATIVLLNGCATRHRVFGPYIDACKIQYKGEVFAADNWQSPQETAKLRAGDCEDQAFYLWNEFRKVGIKSKVVFGFLDIRQRMSLHAWVEIPVGPSKAMILDPSGTIMVPKSMMIMHYVEIIDMPNIRKKVIEFKKRTGLSGFNEAYESPSKLPIPILILPEL